jgi:hypothetical protein
MSISMKKSKKPKGDSWVPFIIDNPTRKFLTNRIVAFFKFGPIKLIYSEKTPSRVKKQPAE